MKEQKTKPTEVQVAAFLDAVEDEQQRKDSYALQDLMQRATGFAPTMWGASIIGFGSYHYKYKSGHEGDAPLVGFSPRKQNISLYLVPGLEEQDELLQALGKHKAGKGCLYIKKIEDINISILEKLVRNSVEILKARYPEGEQKS
ncbi:DUF1801 domain-containing protein [Pontibacter sp. 13R65]|uniref:DUF1801 domain-containing protein n=1 Tax=Pontibacter sp. 13R65 TaxID=3127458 RepID=UPI00301B7968